MIDDKLKQLFIDIKLDCLELILAKDVSISDLSYQLGISNKDFYNTMKSTEQDFSFYLKMYYILLKWR